VIVSIDALRTGSERDLYTVVPISATEPRSQMRPQIYPGDAGVERPSVAVPRAVRSVARARLLRHMGSIPAETLLAIEGALTIILGLD
jgi:mRNA-degrading endonuclease toxin of MazEF toxin-antitoxin module